jgi:anhydro-N-acetylmuramic acid kinase
MNEDDICATFTEITAKSIAEAYHYFGGHFDIVEVLVSGGGSHNRVLMNRIAHHIERCFGHPIPTKECPNTDAKEAMLFAYLAYLSVHGLPGNVPSVTGCEGPRVLGKICYPPTKKSEE